MLRKIFVICLFIILFHGSGSIPLYAYMDEETHPAITQEAVENSDLNNFLKEFLDISEGTDHEFTNNKLSQWLPEYKTKSILEWIKFGSKYEDVGDRALNHFYDPTRNTGLDNLI